MLHDLRYAVRNAWRSPGFFAATLLTLGIGTGANATVFSFINALLLRPVPGVADPSSLVSVYTSDYSSGPFSDTSYPDYVTLKENASALSALALYDEGLALIRVGDATESSGRVAVSPEFFDVLGVRAALGRTLSEADGKGPPAVVIGHRFWQRAFQGDIAVLGRTLSIDGVTYTVVGVAPSDFTGLSISSFDAWVPLQHTALARQRRGDRQFSVIGRLRQGSNLVAAQTQVGAIAARLARDYPESNLGTLQQPNDPRPMSVVHHGRTHPSFRGQVLMFGGVLIAAVLLVLLIACANVASLMLARATTRRREVAIRLALGAGRQRVAQQMLIESLVLAAGGCVLGVLCALWTADILPSFFPREQADLLDAAVDIRVFGYTAAISALAALVFGISPALQAFRTSSGLSLRAAANDTTPRVGGLRRSLIAVQIALATVLLVSAGLLGRSLLNTLSADLGFDMRDGMFANVNVPHDPTGERPLAYFAEALDRVRAVPGVAAATVTTTLPLTRTSRRGFRMDGYVPRPGEDTELNYSIVERSYFRTLLIDVVDGRTFDTRDHRHSAPVVVVNRLFADRYFAGRAVGRGITDSRGTRLEIIGVVPTGPYRTVHEQVPMVFFPFEQVPSGSMRLVARTIGDAEPTAGLIRKALVEGSPEVAVYNVRTLEAHVAEALGGERLTASLLATCGGLAVLLALVGVYGVVSYAVGSRTREIGLRVALGAAPRAIVRLVLGEGVRVLAAGLAVGLVGAALAARLLQSMLFGVNALDARTFGTVIAALAAAAIAAAALPARRALRVDPMVALRHD